MQLISVIRPAAITWTLLLSALNVTVSNENIRAHCDPPFHFSVWKKGLSSRAFANSYFRVKAEAYKQSPNDQSGRGPRVGVTHYDIFRSDDLCRTLQVGVDDKRGVKLILEQCFTDQYLHLQGNNFSNPKVEPKLRVSGCLNILDQQDHPSDMIGPATLLFGAVNFSGDWKPRLAEFDDSLEPKKPTSIDYGPIGTIRVTVEDGAPSEFEHRFQLISIVDRKTDFAKRDPDRSAVMRFSKMVWKSVDGGFIPISYVVDQFEESKGTSVLLQHLEITVEKYELDKEYPNDDLFLPANAIKDGTEVSTNDEFRCEWRDGRIQPVLLK